MYRDEIVSFQQNNKIGACCTAYNQLYTLMMLKIIKILNILSYYKSKMYAQAYMMQLINI